jgi:anti-sigma B factor antagonist
LRDTIDAAVAAGGTRVAVEMRDVAFLDSAGLSALIHGYKRAQSFNQQFEVRDPSRVVLRVLRLTGQLDRFVAPENRATA